MILYPQGSAPDTTTTPADSPVAWHYTSIDGLLGIVSSSRFWASAPIALNDRVEFKYGFDLIRREWEVLRATAATGDLLDFMDDLLSEEWSQSLLDTSFVVSASTSDAIGSQWRAYAGTEGFAIGFRTRGMWWPVPSGQDDFASEEIVIDPLISPVWMQVNYDPERHKQTANDLIAAALRVAASEATPWTRHLLRLQTATGVAIFKHPAFVDEREIRLGVPTVGQPLRFRSSQGRLIPYSEVASYTVPAPNQPRTQRLPLTAVVCAPNSSTSTLTTVRRLLDAHGYSDCEVRQSDLPFS